ncbi:Dabb family protein [Chitinophaga sedimenti]|uniref:Dabb family protein n=1 Tax=Chitinophaga sedimenti TaxID=2033606 RepID=UPI00200592CD|nr:Dabb family protein [Chitinophaga sedimenti]MCK7558748.1 Dabb family protein [Chitinophaga sedimenti]
MSDKKFVHTVNFYLKPDLTPEAVKAFEQGVTALSKVEVIRVFSLGKPASTDRPVIDRSYSYQLLTVFDSQADHDIYQVHPVHLNFVETCNQFWEKVVIFDAESI